MRKLLAVLGLALIAMPAFAEKPAFDARTTMPGWEPRPEASSPAVAFLTEGFEGVFPPAGWTEIELAPAPYNWAQDPLSVHSGSYSARIQWTAAYVQDEILTTGAIDLSTASPTDLKLAFWISTNPYWASSANTEVFLSSDGTNWTWAWDVLTGLTANFVWTEILVDVGAYAGGNLYVMFKYSGTDGADVHLDDVRVDNIAGPVLPLNDTCALAEANGFFILPGAINLTGNNALATHDYSLSSGSCTGYSSTGRDLVWVVDMPSGATLSVTMTTSGWDDSIFLITDCADPHNTCVAGADEYPDGSSFMYTNAGPTTRYYLIVSAYASGTGDFNVTGLLDAPVAIETTSWGRTKALYR